LQSQQWQKSNNKWQKLACNCTPAVSQILCYVLSHFPPTIFLDSFYYSQRSHAQTRIWMLTSLTPESSFLSHPMLPLTSVNCFWLNLFY
jgi:hypothetical protein